MSVTYDMACYDCKVVLWIGQRDRIYCTEKDLKKQRIFFYAHIGHHLEFNSGEVFSARYDFKSLDDLDDEDEPILSERDACAV